MTGLIYKDLLCQTKTLKVYVLIFAIYGVMTATGTLSYAILTTMMFLTGLMLPMNNFSFDVASKWDVYCLALPVSRSRVVAARYLFTLLVIAASTAVVTLMGAVLSMAGRLEGWGEFGLTVGVMTALGLMMNAVMLPLLYKFGAERARAVFFCVFGAVILIAVLSFRFFGGIAWLKSLSGLPEPSPVLLAALPVLLCVAGLLLLAISFLVSRYFYGKREM